MEVGIKNQQSVRNVQLVEAQVQLKRRQERLVRAEEGKDLFQHEEVTLNM